MHFNSQYIRISILILTTNFISACLIGADISSQSGMTKVIIVDNSPNIPKGSFEKVPKTTYLVGSKFARVEEAYDPSMNLHALLIISEPDIWMVNLANKTGKHTIDPGPDFNIHIPVLSGSDKENLFGDFEIGHELDFFRKIKGFRTYSKTMGGEKFDSYSVERKNLMVVVYTRQHSDIPIFVFLFKGNNVISIIRYLEYKKGLPIDPKLFRAPSNIHFSTP